MNRNSTNAPKPPTLDERIRTDFPPGAIYNSPRKLMDTIYERRMRQISSDICSQSDWMETINDADAHAD
ncbi:hypothetical protein GGH94_006034 [Coemansia aciculifera]|uniref:Uncharacterized protein n=1 Tax=Coemansia aciculifera TaxID=417176 RepID=A0A9W8ICH6_9FUNG|nr:hypothetical protein GGH94_006034 [Coemansia aciculifera]